MKIIKILIFLIIFSGCSNLQSVNTSEGVRKLQWVSGKSVMRKLDRLQVGDIIVKNKIASSPTSWFGHSAIVLTPWSVAEYPMIGAGFIQAPLLAWLHEDRDIVVLRYRYMDRRFMHRLLINVKRYSNREYQITFDKYNNRKFYCSQYVWFLYYQTAKELKDPHFDYDFKRKDKLILPYDLLELPNFEVVPMN